MKTLTKKDLAVRIARETDMTQQEVATIIQKILDNISDTIVSMEKIEFRDFGVFKCAVRKTRKGRNPKKPQDEVIIPEHVVIKFTPGEQLKNRVNQIDPKKIK